MLCVYNGRLFVNCGMFYLDYGCDCIFMECSAYINDCFVVILLCSMHVFQYAM